MKAIPNTLFILLAGLCLFLSACGESGNVDVASTPLEGNKDTLVQDQIAYTLEQTPEAPIEGAPVEEVKLAPQRNNETPASRPASANLQKGASPATPPEQDGLRVDDETTEEDPITEEQITEAPAGVRAPDHGAWNTLLQKHVSPTGVVDYRGFQADEARLDAYLATLAKATPGDGWTRNESLAYWTNGYNAFTIKLILDHWPVKSIRDIDEPWDEKWIELDGKTYSLNQIEHEIVRPTFNEPRIHFAFVCAARSCPPLANQAYTANNLESMLERQTRNFIRNEQFNVTQEETVRVSSIFDWYGEDFGDVRAYLNRYLENDIPAASKINFLDYDWSLNNG